jgi:hypothetical protein
MSDATAKDAALLSQIRHMTRAARYRARRNGLSSDDDLVGFAGDLFHAQHGRCALTGLPFDLRKVGTGQARRPFAPSLDRIEGDKGYTKDNVRLVCQAVNFALNRFGEDIFYEIARAAMTQVGRIPESIACLDSADEAERKRRYIDFVVDEAPKLLRRNGSAMPKSILRQHLRQRYGNTLPTDEGNAYGWAFRRLTEAGVIHPASNSRHYELRV